MWRVARCAARGARSLPRAHRHAGLRLRTPAPPARSRGELTAVVQLPKPLHPHAAALFPVERTAILRFHSTFVLRPSRIVRKFWILSAHPKRGGSCITKTDPRAWTHRQAGQAGSGDGLGEREGEFWTAEALTAQDPWRAGTGQGDQHAREEGVFPVGREVPICVVPHSPAPAVSLGPTLRPTEAREKKHAFQGPKPREIVR